MMKEYFAFQWHITEECDQRCKHCYIFSEDNFKKTDSMSWKQMQETFYNCLDFCEVYDRQPYFLSQAEIPSCILISGACSRCLKITIFPLPFWEIHFI